MSTIRVRRILSNGDIAFGQGKADYLVDLDAVVQIVRTRLKFFQGEWWEDLNDGLPLWQKILGVSGANKQAIDALLKQRILSCPYVTGIQNVTSTFESGTRAYSFQAVVNTEFGQVGVSNT